MVVQSVTFIIEYLGIKNYEINHIYKRTKHDNNEYTNT